MQDYRYREAVCRVSCKRQVHSEDPYTPQMLGKSSGTAFFVKLSETGKVAILTCAHVVSCAFQIHLEFVQPNGEILQCRAFVKKRLACVDLALLELDHRHPNANILAARMQRSAMLLYDGNQSLAQLKTESVTVCGYQLTFTAVNQAETEGKIARMQLEYMVYSQYEHCILSITNRVNKGFSGAPLILNGPKAKVLGMIHQGASQSKVDGEHSAVSWFYLALLLRANENDTLLNLHGVGVFPAKYQALEAPDHREALGMTTQQTGVRITYIPDNSFLRRLKDAQNQPLVEVGDIVLKVNGEPVANQGHVVDKVLQTPLDFSIYAFNRAPLGSIIEMEIGRTILKDGVKKLDVRTLKIPNVQVSNYFYAIRERPNQLYFFAGGVTFCSYDRDMVSYLSFSEDKKIADYFLSLMLRKRKEGVNELVFAHLAFNHDSLDQKHSLTNGIIVTHVNGTRIKSLYHLQEVIAISRKLKEPTFTIQLENKDVYHLQHFTEEMVEAITEEKNLKPTQLSNLRRFGSVWRELSGKRKIEAIDSTSPQSHKILAMEKS